ncbi:MAG: phosphoribosylpyrophosphate synthetase [Lewinellaceae bacterium]|nr:phosphoribosylpyrophosphate synthetase [Lewinellaceae bacterium]
MIAHRTLSEAIAQLRKRGYEHDFKFENGKLTDLQTKKNYAADELEIIEYHRFEGQSNPGDMSIVFAISCADGSKGSVVTSYGTYHDYDLLSFLNQVPVADKTKVAGVLHK